MSRSASSFHPRGGKGIAAAVFAALLAASPVAAESYASAPDARIRTLFYDPDRVVRIDAFYGYQLMVQFSATERIENVAIGDGAAWQVTPNKAADLLFIKPVERAPPTNMTVVTDQRSYLFELDAHPVSARGEYPMTYVVRFTYPPPPAVAVVAPPPPPAPPERRNTAFSYTGARELVPSVVFDDGRFTYLKWPKETPVPAIFAISSDGSESLVNSSWRDGFVAVEEVAPKFQLRDGRAVTTLVNEGWRPPERGPDAPQPLDRKTARRALHEGTAP